jgi:hypothetical protein
MRVKPELPFDQVPDRERRRIVTRSVIRSTLLSVAIVVGYFVLPMTNLLGFPGLYLAVGIAGLAWLMFWQLRAIAHSPFPRLRAVGTIATTVPLFFTLFASVYYLMDLDAPGMFNEPLSRLDALYFTVTVFATVGFGDIVAVAEPARAVVLVQMVGGLTIVGLMARAIVRAVEVGLNSRDRDE